MKIDIETAAKNLGEEIGAAILAKYGVDPVIKHDSFLGGFLDGILSGGYSRLKVEEEIWRRSLHVATKFFLDNSDMKFDDKIINNLKHRLSDRLINPKEIKNMEPEKVLANVIKVYADDFLLEAQ